MAGVLGHRVIALTAAGLFFGIAGGAARQHGDQGQLLPKLSASRHTLADGIEKAEKENGPAISAKFERSVDFTRTERKADMRIIAFVLAAIVSGGSTAFGETRKIDFEADVVGGPPKGFLFGHTAKMGAPGKWVVQAEGTDKFLAQTDADSTRSRFPVAVLEDIATTDVDLSVRFKPVSGRVDRAAGLVWRYQDEDNYYIVRANALEGNVVLYKVEKGKRTDLPLKGEGRTYGKKAEVPSGQWSTLRIVAAGPRFEAYLDGTKLYEVEDTTFTRGGRVGLWTKADSVTQFDDLTVVTR